MKKLLFIGFLALSIVACNKNQSAVRKIDGKWKAESYTISNGTTVTDVLETTNLDYEYNFETCKLKTEETCGLSIVQRDSTGEEEAQNLNFAIIEDGDKMEITGEGIELQLFTIKELKSGSLIIENLANGLINTIEFRR